MQSPLQYSFGPHSESPRSQKGMRLSLREVEYGLSFKPSPQK